MTRSRFYYSIYNEDLTDTKDEFGYKKDYSFSMSRIFTHFVGKRSVDHAFFSISNSLKGGGFAKNMMKNFYKQYLQSNIEQIAVHANLTLEKPINGANTWGKWGFTGDWNQISSIISNARPGKYEVQRKVVDHDTPDLELGDDHIVVTTKRKGDKYRSVVNRTIDLTQEKINKVKSEFENLRSKGGERCRLKHLYNACEKDTMLAIMQSESWGGTVDLTDPVQKKDFEENLFRVY